MPPFITTGGGGGNGTPTESHTYRVSVSLSKIWVVRFVSAVQKSA